MNWSHYTDLPNSDIWLSVIHRSHVHEMAVVVPVVVEVMLPIYPKNNFGVL